ncbi:hypothetical protein ACFFGH_21375 [Lysobacter korlensis]|uniref:Polyketide cyclase n=1 Tax=Lysobacter korlensis TaxID=553636 RepID=A0ABV6RTS6_9GAMM
MRRIVGTWAALFALFVVSFALVVVALNATLFSPGGLVRSYLEALARHDVPGALELAGVSPTERDVLLDARALGRLTDIHQRSDEQLPDGTHRVEFDYRTDAGAGRTEFLLEPAGTRFGVFGAWRFAEPPVAQVEVTVLHDPRFDVNGLEVVGAANEPRTYRVLAPGAYEFGHETTYLEAAEVEVAVSASGELAEARVDVAANERFVAEVQRDLGRYLDACAEQRVLLPTGCPFGKQVANRIESEPRWTMSEYPPVTLRPAEEPGTWLMPPTEAAVRLRVDIRSLFDGTVTRFDEDVPFTVSLLISFQANGRLYIEALE